MPTTLSVQDQAIPGKTFHGFVLTVLTERITVRELIRSRVYQEVHDYNVAQPEHYRGLVQPTDAAATHNGYRLRRRRSLDWKAQFERAIEAFEAQLRRSSSVRREACARASDVEPRSTARGRRRDFVRIPKHGITKKGASWLAEEYRSPRTWPGR